MHKRNNGCNFEEEDVVDIEEDNNSCVSFEEDKTKMVILLPLIMAWYGTVAIGDVTVTSVVCRVLVELVDDVVDLMMADASSICCCPANTVTLLEIFISTESPQATSGP